MENLTNEEKDYYELLVDLLDNGDISVSERNILNKRKEKYSISDSQAKELEEFAKLNNGDNSNSLLEEGKTYYNNKEYGKAIESLSKAVKLNSNKDLNWYWLGRSYNDNEQYKDAIESLLKAVELNPNDCDSWYLLGSSYIILGEEDNAKIALKKTLEINPNHQEAKNNLKKLNSWW